jgi:hypothetical protein
MDENVEWIEEFLIYYINLGFEQFYLYDNTGSIGRQSQDAKTTKYGFPIIKKPRALWRHIYNKYKKYITYIKYQPTNKKGQIVYGTNNCNRSGIIKFIKDFKHEAEWCYIGDFDEFIFSPTNDNLLTLINNTTEPIITFYQKMFLHRCLTSEKFITQEFKCINNLQRYQLTELENLQRLSRDDILKASIKSYGGQKNIIKLDSINGVNSCHSFRGRKKVIPLEQWRINHYNFCPYRELILNKQSWEYEHSVDTSMGRYSHMLAVSRYGYPLIAREKKLDCLR